MIVVLTALAWGLAAFCLLCAFVVIAACRLSGMLSAREEAHLIKLQQGEQQ